MLNVYTEKGGRRQPVLPCVFETGVTIFIQPNDVKRSLRCTTQLRTSPGGLGCVTLNLAAHAALGKLVLLED